MFYIICFIFFPSTNLNTKYNIQIISINIDHQLELDMDSADSFFMGQTKGMTQSKMMESAQNLAQVKKFSVYRECYFQVAENIVLVFKISSNSSSS